jgi:hypothetical protein
MNVNDPEFRKYGRVVKGYDCSELLNAMKETPLPKDVIYVPADAKLESFKVFTELKNREFGGLPIQLGYCNGNNTMLNAVEYHRSSEINIAATDAVFLVGCQQDIDPDNFTYDTSKIEAFLVPAGTVVEVYATTLHFAPCNADKDGFRVVVVLPAGTNLPLETKQDQLEDRLLFARNKWLIAHPDTDLGGQGAFVGLVGKNRSVEE